MKNIFKKRKPVKSASCKVAIPKEIQSAEDTHMKYMEMPDGLRLRFQDGKYVGWYVTEAK